MGIGQCVLEKISSFQDNRGELSWIEGGDIKVPFDIKRIFYIQGVPENVFRGGHAHKKAHQFITPVNGFLQIKINDGKSSGELTLYKSHGLYVPPMIWCDLYGFFPNLICLVLSSEHFDENDYIRDYDNFIKEIS